ncbi:hypothetical protein D6C77_06741 [Aureobasidium pullulans]|nr:hypothetical protein D6C77_06741 [Aureobasidium pullulans]
MLPSISYRAQPLSPAFGSPTARANFCEEDFVIVSFIAEFINTCTNAAYIFYAARALRRLPKDASFAAKSLYYGLGLVGVCSSLFHGLLSYHAQMADDTSMIVATSIVLQRAMTYRKTPTFINWFSGLLLLAVITETTYHVMMDEQTVHELSFVSLIIAVAAKTRSLIKLRVQQPKDKKMLQKAVIFGAGKPCAIPVASSSDTSSGNSTLFSAPNSRQSSAWWVCLGAFYLNSTDGGIFSQLLEHTPS